MRIISGSLGKRRLNTPNNLKLRPTTDQAKEGLFNILSSRLYFDELKVLDLFSGTGAIGYEFISRGAISVTSVENNLIHFKYITSVKKDFNLENLFPVKNDVFKFLNYNSQSYDLIFADPPFDLEELEKLPELILNGEHLIDKGILILEHPEKYDFSENKNFREKRRYGKVHFSFFEKCQ